MFGSLHYFCNLLCIMNMQFSREFLISVLMILVIRLYAFVVVVILFLLVVWIFQNRKYLRTLCKMFPNLILFRLEVLNTIFVQVLVVYVILWLLFLLSIDDVQVPVYVFFNSISWVCTIERSYCCRY